MSEILLSRKEVAIRLGMSCRSFTRYRAKLVAMGLQPVRIGQYPKFRETSLNKLIKKLAEKGDAVC